MKLVVILEVMIAFDFGRYPLQPGRAIRSNIFDLQAAASHTRFYP